MSDQEATDKYFWEHVDQSGECWLWTGQIGPNGYGRIHVSGAKMTPAHRYSYELKNAPIPDGLVIDHLCRNRKCVNPEHLEAVTWEENVKRGLAFGARNGLRDIEKKLCPKGHDDWNIYNAQGWRSCRTCVSDQRRARRSELRAALTPKEEG